MDWTASLQGLVGGVLIGFSAVWLMGTMGRIAGISGIVGNLITQRP
ncbi:MAG: YeeE/YedE family protein, partial [Pseudomonadota bacterium]